MEIDSEIYTVTMARVYAEQGLWKKAAEVYRFLLEQEPQREDLAAELAKVESYLRTGVDERLEGLVSLLQNWFDLIFQYNRMKRLRKLEDEF
jgi:hypothetical protein